MQNAIVHNCSGGGNYIHSDDCSSHSSRTRSVSKKKAYSLAEQCLLIICRGSVFWMGTVTVQVVCVGGGRSVPSFIITLSIFRRLINFLSSPHPLVFIQPILQPINAPAVHTTHNNCLVCLIVRKLSALIQFPSSKAAFGRCAILMWGDRDLAGGFL